MQNVVYSVYKHTTPDELVYIWWIGHKWYIALPKKKGGEE